MNRERAFKLLDECGLDAVVATTYENLTYVSGAYIYTQRTVPTRMSAILLTNNGDATYVFCSIEEAQIRDQSWIGDLRGYREFAEDPMDILAALLREKKLDGKKIGLERRFLGADHVTNLEQNGAAAQYVDSTTYFKKLRMIKTDAEIALLERAATTTRKAVEAAFTAAKPGDTEKQIANNIVHHLFDQGCDETAFITLAAASNGSRAHHIPDQTRVERGQVVRTDLGGYFTAYYSDLARTYVVGQPTKEQATTYAALNRIYREIISKMTVGRPVNELYRICKEGFEREGLAFFMPHIGHSIGVELHELPIVHPKEDTLLQENMVFNIEPFYRDTLGNGYHVEDLIHITARGPRILSGTLAPEEIPVIA
jgi:Xaa-Pro aminopeptidase